MPGSFVGVLNCASDVTLFHFTGEHYMGVGFHFFCVVGGDQGLDCGVFLFLENGIFRYGGIGILLNVKDEKIPRILQDTKILKSKERETVKRVEIEVRP